MVKSKFLSEIEHNHNTSKLVEKSYCIQNTCPVFKKAVQNTCTVFKKAVQNTCPVFKNRHQKRKETNFSSKPRLIMSFTCVALYFA